jgi:hypothetical protein
MPTNLPTTHEPNNRNLTGLGADAWAGIAVVLGLFIVGAIYWSGHTNAASAGAPQTVGPGALKDDGLTGPGGANAGTTGVAD